MLMQLRPRLYSKILINQNWFRTGRFTTPQVGTRKCLIKGITAKNVPAVTKFVEFGRAFTFMHQGNLMEILAACRCPSNI